MQSSVITQGALACSVAILAGGEGKRLEGRDKGLVTWCDRPMVAWISAAARPFTDDLLIVCNRNAVAYAPYADRVLGDAPGEAYQGPLAGVRAALRIARYPRLLILPCDCPTLDDDLLHGLLEPSVQPRVLRRGARWEPMFAVLSQAILPHLDSAWAQGERSLWRILQSLDPQAYDLPENDLRMLNCNTPEQFDPNQSR